MNLPNKLTVLRILLVPVLIICMLARFPYHNWVALAVFVVASLTDLADGKIARKYGMVTDFGKFMDPLADKLTQGAAAICVARNHPQLFLLFGLMAVKELTQAYIGARSMKQTGQAFSARWYGKACTVITTTCLMIMFAFPKIPESWINGMLILCAIVMLVTLALYANYFIKSRAAAVPGKEQAS